MEYSKHPLVARAREVRAYRALKEGRPVGRVGRPTKPCSRCGLNEPKNKFGRCTNCNKYCWRPVGSKTRSKEGVGEGALSPPSATTKRPPRRLLERKEYVPAPGPPA